VIILIDNLNGFPHIPGFVVLVFSDVPSLFRSKSILKVIGIPRTTFHVSQLIRKAFTAVLFCN